MPKLGRLIAPLLVCRTPSPNEMRLSLATVMPSLARAFQCDPNLPLPFVSFASQKNFIALYHMGLYANEEHMAWFKASWDPAQWGKLDMGKSCIRFKNMDKIPWDLLSELATKITPKAWISHYEGAFLKS